MVDVWCSIHTLNSLMSSWFVQYDVFILELSCLIVILSFVVSLDVRKSRLRECHLQYACK